MDRSRGYQALREGVAWLELKMRGVIRATGEDRARLLHAMSTNQIQQMKPGQGCYAFFLTAQGKIIADAEFLCFDEHFLLDLEPEARQIVYQHLERYIIADDVALEDISDFTGEIQVEGPKAVAFLKELGATPPAEPFHHSTWENAVLARVNVTGGTGFRLLFAKDRVGEIVAKLEAAGAVAASEDDARIVRIENGKPRLGEDIFETTLPMETQQMHSLHFNKGCYLGQEIVERVRSRGHVNRLLSGFRLNTDTPPEKGAPVSVKGEEVGRVTTAVFSPAEGRVAGMAYMRVPNGKPGTEIAIGGVGGVTTPVADPARF